MGLVGWALPTDVLPPVGGQCPPKKTAAFNQSCRTGKNRVGVKTQPTIRQSAALASVEDLWAVPTRPDLGDHFGAVGEVGVSGIGAGPVFGVGAAGVGVVGASRAGAVVPLGVEAGVVVAEADGVEAEPLGAGGAGAAAGAGDATSELTGRM
jgi:hypothetical protein